MTLKMSRMQSFVGSSIFKSAEVRLNNTVNCFDISEDFVTLSDQIMRDQNFHRAIIRSGFFFFLLASGQMILLRRKLFKSVQFFFCQWYLFWIRDYHSRMHMHENRCYCVLSIVTCAQKWRSATKWYSKVVARCSQRHAKKIKRVLW